MKQKIIDLAQQMCTTVGVSGNEENISEIIKKILLSIGTAKTTALGSVVCEISKGKKDMPHLVLTAHLDQIGMIVTKVEENGFLRVAAVGGMDRRLLPAQRVVVHTFSGDVTAVVASVPPHLADGEEKVPKMEDVLIDTGLEKAEAKILSVGDIVSFKSTFNVLNQKYITAAALDNRIGCVAVLMAAEELAKQNTDCKISVLFASQEEVGGAGALADICALKPDIAIAVDVSFANGFGVPAQKCGKLGDGAMVGISPILNRKMWQRMLKIAQENHIPCQTEVMGGRTGTDADSIVPANGGVKTALLSIPLRNMHTAVELVKIDDVASVVNIIKQFAMEAQNYVD